MKLKLKNLFLTVGGAVALAVAGIKAAQSEFVAAPEIGSDVATPDETKPHEIMPRRVRLAEPKNYLNAETTWQSWLFTLDHKRIAILYMLTITGFFLIGGAAATLMRLELATPQADVLKAHDYNKMFTMHGVIMVWFFLIPSIPTVLGNFLIPMMIGARDLAFPKLNLASWYIFVFGGIVTLGAMLWGGVDTGWTFYTPFSTMFSNGAVITTVVGVIIVGFSSIFTGLNFIVTIHKMRAPGLTWFRLPLFVWTHYATSIILVLATPVLAATLILIGLERLFHIGIFDPKLGARIL